MFQTNKICLKHIYATLRTQNKKHISQKDLKMKVIDLKKTRARFENTGRMIVPWARAKKKTGHDITIASFRNFMCGRYVPSPGSATEEAFYKALAEDDLLVLKEIPDEEEDDQSAKVA